MLALLCDSLSIPFLRSFPSQASLFPASTPRPPLLSMNFPGKIYLVLLAAEAREARAKVKLVLYRCSQYSTCSYMSQLARLPLPSTPYSYSSYCVRTHLLAASLGTYHNPKFDPQASTLRHPPSSLIPCKEIAPTLSNL